MLPACVPSYPLAHEVWRVVSSFHPQNMITLLFIFYVVYRGDLNYGYCSLVCSYVRRWRRPHPHIGMHAPPFFLRGMAECRGIISLMHYSICERIRRDSRYIAALAFQGFRGQALLQVCSWSLDSLISCKSAGEGDNGPHPRVGGFAPGRGAAHSLRSRKRVEFSHRLRQKKRKKENSPGEKSRLSAPSFG